MKFAVFTVMLPDLTPAEAARELADAGYDGVEWRVTYTPAEAQGQPPSFWGANRCTFAPTAEEGARAGKLAAEAGLAIPTLGTYIAVGDLDAVEQALAFAQAAGAPALRVGAARWDGSAAYSALLDQTRRFLQDVEAMVRRAGVKALVEIHHGTIAASASLAQRLVEGRDPERIGVIYDAGNMVYEGYEDHRLGLELLGPYLAHVHVKNAAYDCPAAGGVWAPRWSPLEDGVVDFAALFAALRGVGYDGWVAVEDFSRARPSRAALRHNLEFLTAL